MDTSVIDLDTKVVGVYNNEGKPNVFKVRNFVMLFVLKDQLGKINCQLNHIDTSRVDGVEY